MACCHDLYAINKVSNVHRKNGVVSFFKFYHKGRQSCNTVQVQRVRYVINMHQEGCFTFVFIHYYYICISFILFLIYECRNLAQDGKGFIWL